MEITTATGGWQMLQQPRIYTVRPLEWLAQSCQGFDELCEEARQAILDFTLLWSLFEANALKCAASAESIQDFVRRRFTPDRRNVDVLKSSLEHFRNRYFSNGEFTEKFDQLHLRKNDKPEIVYQVLRGENDDDVDCMLTLLIIVYRLRNNLFHGLKWAYGIRGQQSNFEYANVVLMAAIEIAD